MKRLSPFLAACLVAGTALAQAPNDVGTGSQNNPMLPPGPQGGPPPGCETCPPTGPQIATITGNFSETERIFRDGIPSVCPIKPFPGTFAGNFFYEPITYHNFGPAACFTVNFDPTQGATPCGDNSTFFNAHLKVYAPTYDPNNQSVGFLGDIGSSATGSFSMEAPADSDFVIVAENPFDPTVCTFEYEVIQIPCQTDPSLCEIPVELQSFELEGVE